jgi:hypothetical protein
MNRKKTMTLTVLLWACCCLVHFYFRTIAIFQGPHESDLYVFNWGFQGFCFVLLKFPLWLCGLGLVLWVESICFSRNIPEKDTP